jgi:hypothetical protein
MVNTPDYWMYVTYFLPQTPMYAAWFIGLILAVVRWNHHPKVSLLVSLATVLLFLNAVVATLLQIWLIQHSRDQAGFSTVQMSTMLNALGFARTLVSAVGWALMLAAAFVGRGRWLAEWQEGDGPPS